MSVGGEMKAAIRASICLLGGATAMFAFASDKPRSIDFFEPGADRMWETHMEFENKLGRVAIGTLGEPFNTKTHPFFSARDSNGRACVTCHQPASAMSLSAELAQQRWDATNGKDPLFAAIDGSNCPDLPQGKRDSHSLLLNKGLFRVALPWPPVRADGTPVEPEFDLEVVRDPTGCNLNSEHGLKSSEPRVSVFRRSRMTANLRYLSTPKYPWYNSKTMAPLDRDPVTGDNSSMAMTADGRATSVAFQTHNAGRTHMGLLKSWSDAQIRSIEDFTARVHAAAHYSNGAGNLAEPGGPRALGIDAVKFGQSHINGNDRDTGVFFFFDQWKPGGSHAGASKEQKEFRESVARGYDAFFGKPFWISETYGLNTLRLGNPYKNTCSFCHTVQLMGIDAVPGWMDLGTQNFPHAENSDDLPLFKVTCKASANPHPYLGRTIYTHDPGRALQSGRCDEVGAITMQQFRGIAARSPYFSNGSAATLMGVIDFYDRRYRIGFSEREKQDLVNFLSVL
jgi:hypothetical protein